MELTAIKSAEKTAEKLLTQKDDIISELTDKISEKKAAIAKAESEMDTATMGGDISAYRRAKEAREDAAADLEMYNKRLVMMRDKPIISKTEYDSLVKSIYDEISTLEAATREKLAELSDAMKAAADNLNDATNRANAILSHIQKDLYRDADRTIAATGKMLFMNHETKSVNTSGTVSWGRSAAHHTPYAAYTESKSAED